MGRDEYLEVHLEKKSKVMNRDVDPLQTFVVPTSDGSGEVMTFRDKSDISFSSSTSNRAAWKKKHHMGQRKKRGQRKRK